MAEAFDARAEDSTTTTTAPVIGTGGNPTSGEGNCRIPAGRSWEGGWELLSDLAVQVQTTPEAVLVIAGAPVEEYGAGLSVEEAAYDLLTSLSEYHESLEEREARLGASAAADLAKLRSIIRRRCQR